MNGRLSGTGTLVVLVTATVMCQPAAGTACAAEPVRMLFAGSSSTYWNDMPREVATVVSGSIVGCEHRSAIATIVGRSGDDIRVYAEPGFSGYQYGVVEGQTFLEKIATDRPNFLVLQVVSRFILGNEPAMPPPLDETPHAIAVTRYCEAIRSAGGEPVFYEMGWNRDPTAEVGRSRIHALASTLGIRRFAPCSTAWAIVGEEHPELALQHPSDKSHPGDLGHFLNLACFLAAFSEKSPEGLLPRKYHVWPHALAKPSDEAARRIDEAVIAAFEPDAYQATMPAWMRRNMAHATIHSIDDDTARILEQAAWQAWRKAGFSTSVVQEASP